MVVSPDEHGLAIVVGQLAEAGEQQQCVGEHAGVHGLHQHALQEVHCVGAALRCGQLRPLPQDAVGVHQLLRQCRVHSPVVAQTL